MWFVGIKFFLALGLVEVNFSKHLHCALFGIYKDLGTKFQIYRPLWEFVINWRKFDFDLGHLELQYLIFDLSPLWTLNIPSYCTFSIRGTTVPKSFKFIRFLFLISSDEWVSVIWFSYIDSLTKKMLYLFNILNAIN